MAEFVLQQDPQVSPKSCFFCGAFEGPFVNTMTFDYPGKTILMCAPNERRESGCAGQIVNLIGGLTPAAARDLRLERDVARDELEAVRLRLQRFRDEVYETVAVD